MRSETNYEHNCALHCQVDAQRNKGGTNHLHSPVLPSLCNLSELPEHDSRRTNFNDAIQSESGQCNRSCRDRSEGEDDHANHVPAERHYFELASTPKQLPTALFIQ